MTQNFLRRCNISLTGSSDVSIPGGDPTDLRVTFKIGASTMQTPNVAQVSINGPNPQTIAAFKNKEFRSLRIDAGYVGNMGFLYKGDIQQSTFRHEDDNVTSTLTIFCATAGNPYQRAHVNKTLAKGWTPMDKAKLALDAMKPFGITGFGVINTDLSGPARPRGRAVVGMAHEIFREVALSANALWFMDKNDKVHIVDHTKPVPGNGPIVLNSDSGLVGWPEQTENGIVVRCFINPAIDINTLVKIDEASINEAERDNNLSGGFGTTGPRNQALDMAGRIAADGLYRVAFCEVEADTRGQPWYMTLTCIALSGSLNKEQSRSITTPLTLGQY